MMIMSSPVSPRVKNIKQDMEALLISRQDNPYISQKLELLSTATDFQSTSHLSSASMVQINVHDDSEQGLISMDFDVVDDELAFTSAILDEPGLNLHEHLIRSPPPQFPQKVSHFVFPDAIGSPLRGCMLTSSCGGKSFPMSPLSCRGRNVDHGEPELSLLTLTTPPPPPHATPNPNYILTNDGRRCSHPMDDDVGPTLSTLTPLLPSQRAVSGPLPALSPLPALARGGATSSTLIANMG